MVKGFLVAESPLSRLCGLNEMRVPGFVGAEIIRAKLRVGPAGTLIAVTARPVLGEVVQEAA